MKTEEEVKAELDRLKIAHRSNLLLYRLNKDKKSIPEGAYPLILERYMTQIRTLKWVLNINEE